MKEKAAYYKPGIPTDPATTMGAIDLKTQYDRVLPYIDSAKAEGARCFMAGERPSDPKLAKGFYVEPSDLCRCTAEHEDRPRGDLRPRAGDLQMDGREDEMLRQVNAVEYGLTCSIWTNDSQRRASHRDDGGGRLRLGQ